LIIPTKVYLGRNRSFAAGFDDTDKGLSRLQSRQAVGFDVFDKSAI